MPWITANNKDRAASPDDLTIFTNTLYTRPNLHDSFACIPEIVVKSFNILFKGWPQQAPSCRFTQDFQERALSACNNRNRDSTDSPVSGLAARVGEQFRGWWHQGRGSLHRVHLAAPSAAIGADLEVLLVIRRTPLGCAVQRRSGQPCAQNGHSSCRRRWPVSNDQRVALPPDHPH